MAECSQSSLLKEMEKQIAIGGEGFRDQFYDFLTENVGLTNLQASSILRGGSLSKFSDGVILQIAEYLAPLNISPQEAALKFKRAPATKADEFIGRKRNFFRDNESFMMAGRPLFRFLSINYEAKYGKDICEATKQELVDTLSQKFTKSYRYLQNTLPAFRHYLDWCQDQGFEVPHIDDLKSVMPQDIDLSQSLATKLVSGPEELNDILSEIKTRIDARKVFVAVLVWLGFKIEEIQDLQEDQVDSRNKIIQHPVYGTMTIPDELIDYFYDYEQYISGYNLERKIEDTSNYIKRIDMRGRLDSGCISANTLRQYLSQINVAIKELKYMSYDLSYKGLSLSGTFWKLMQAEKEHGELRNEDIAQYARISNRNTAKIQYLKRMYVQFRNMYGE